MRLRTLALAAGGLVVGYGVERAVLGRKRRPDSQQLAAFRTPEDAVHRTIATSDGGELHVVERGTGRPLVFLHGITLSALTWHYQLIDMADRFRVLAVDHRGHGASRSGSGEWTLERLALDVAELLEDLDLRDAILVGHSMGGMVALRLLLDLPDLVPERVAGVVLMSTTGGPVHRLAAWKGLSKAVTPRVRRGLELVERAPGGLFPASDLTHLIFRLGMGAGASPTHVELNRLITSATPVSVWGELLSEVLGFNVVDRLHAVTVPAAVFVGSRDLLTPPGAARQLVAALPNVRPLEVFPGAGHMLMLERRQDVDERISRFATELS